MVYKLFQNLSIFLLINRNYVFIRFYIYHIPNIMDIHYKNIYYRTLTILIMYQVIHIFTNQIIIFLFCYLFKSISLTIFKFI